MATKKLKLEEEAITEILVADTDSESGAEVRGGGGGGEGGEGGEEGEEEEEEGEEEGEE
jgi:hypothetical protein